MRALLLAFVFCIAGVAAAEELPNKPAERRAPDFTRQGLFKFFVEQADERAVPRPGFESGVTLYRSKALGVRFSPLLAPLRYSSAPDANVSINPSVDPFVLTHTFW